MKKKIISIITTCLVLISIPFSAFAHSGRTDSSGGHKDNKNKSGLGYYHYHCGGYPAHLHNGGVCPYKSSNSSSSSSYTSSNTSKISYSYGWSKSNGNWYYYKSNGSYLKNEWKKIDSKWYYFYGNGVMAKSTWIVTSGKWYYLGSDGAMYTNRTTPDGYYVNYSGVWVK